MKVAGILTHQQSTSYNDLPEVRYHFPVNYLKRVEAILSEGGLIAYYEPGRSSVGEGVRRGRRAYVALARITGISEDPDAPGTRYYANVADFLAFDEPVPLEVGGVLFEGRAQPLRRTGYGTYFRSAVRLIDMPDFERILQAGFKAAREPWEESASEAPELRDPLRVVTTRSFRERRFRRQVLDAYDRTCAFTGLRILNGKGRPEVQAAHIRPVELRGPDSVRNGLPVSGTIHFLLDRGLLGIGPGNEVLVSGTGVPDAIRRLLRPQLILPSDPHAVPARAFVDYHRKAIFKP